MNNLIDLLSFGQSYWLDNLTRNKITSGEIKDRVTNAGLRGITSNPSIFNKAIADSDSYDDQIKELVEKGVAPGQIYEFLTVKDLQDACDILLPVYHDSGGVDGFVSLEVSPYLARDTQGTVEEAKRLYKEVDRPNCYIKIPGTKEGLPAIEQMLYEGIPINITLLFSVERYAEVANAYVHALEHRAAEGLSVDNIRSVASFFLSRIDILTDQLLGTHIMPELLQNPDVAIEPASLLGKAGIASARLAYRKFREVFSTPSWKKLQGQGAHVQRPLWASTGNKNPLYDNLRYVESLIGTDTVNTLPDETIEMLAAKGQLRKNSIEEGLDEALKLPDQLKKFDIDLEIVTQQLENEGIRKFIESYNKLIADLAKKRKEIIKESDSVQLMNCGGLKAEVDADFVSLDEKRAGRWIFVRTPQLLMNEAELSKALQPLVLLGLPVNGLMKSALQMKASCDPYIPAASNPGISLGCFLGVASRRGRDHVTCILSPSILAFSNQLEQLLSERKAEEGWHLVSDIRKEPGNPKDYGNDRVFVHILLSSDIDPAQENKISALEQAGFPVARITLPDLMALGGEFYRWKVATAVASYIMGANPFHEK